MKQTGFAVFLVIKRNRGSRQSNVVSLHSPLLVANCNSGAHGLLPFACGSRRSPALRRTAEVSACVPGCAGQSERAFSCTWLPLEPPRINELPPHSKYPVPQTSSVTTPVTCLMRGPWTVMAINLSTFYRSLAGSTGKVQSHEFHLTFLSPPRCPK